MAIYTHISQWNMFFLAQSKNVSDSHTMILLCTSCWLNLKKNPPDAAKVATLIKHSLMLIKKKFLACVTCQVPDIEFVQPLWNIDVYLRVSFTVVDIYISKWQQTLNQTNLKRDTTISFLVGGLAVWSMSKNQLKPVCSSSSENVPKITPLSPQNRCRGHQGDLNLDHFVMKNYTVKRK